MTSSGQVENFSKLETIENLPRIQALIHTTPFIRFAGIRKYRDHSTMPFSVVL